MKKIKSVQFNYEDGDYVRVLAKTEAEESIFDALRSSVTGNRKKHGDICGVAIGIARDTKVSVGIAGTLPDVLKCVDAQMKGLAESDIIPEILKRMREEDD